MTRFLHTPILRRLSLLALGAAMASSAVQAQAAVPAALDALSITVQRDSTTVARGSLRFRQVRTGTDVELVANGTLVRKGLRVSAELRTDSAYVLRKYVAESRDSAGVLIDRVQVTNAGGRVTLERVTPRRRLMREYAAQRDLMILDSATAVPFVMLAGTAPREGAISFLDVRSGLVTPGRTLPGTPGNLSLSEAIVSGTPVSVTGLTQPLTWWRDARGHLLRVVWGDRAQVLRDDPPAS